MEETTSLMTDGEDDRTRMEEDGRRQGGYYEDTHEFKPQTWRQKFYIFYVTGIGAIGGLLFGYDTGVISGALLQINDYFDLSNNDFKKEAVVSITVLGAIIGAAGSGVAANSLGRKPVVMIASVIFIAGAIMMGLAHSLALLLIGRWTVGVGIGQASMVVPMYIAEMAPPNFRGRLVTVNTLFVTGGQFIATLVDGSFSGRKDGWRWMLGLGALPAILQLVGLIGLPESPRQLVSKGKINEARNALIKLRGRPDRRSTKESVYGSSSQFQDETKYDETSAAGTIQDRESLLGSFDSTKLTECSTPKSETETNDPIEIELNEIREAVKEETRQKIPPAQLNKQKKTSSWSPIYFIATMKYLFTTPSVRKALLVGCILQFLQQCAGINTVMYYSGIILQNAGFNQKMAIWLTSVVAFTNFVFSGIGLRFVETFGRRKLTLFSTAGVTISLLILGSVFYVKRHYSASAIAPPEGMSVSNLCQKFDSCGSCVLNDKCGFLGNSTKGYCLSGDSDSPSSYPSDYPSSFKWEFDRCLGSVQQDLGWAALASLMLYLIWFAPGLASMPWVINSEIYPTQVRSTAVSIATTVNWIFNLLISLTFLSLATLITSFGVFCLYASIALVCGVFLYFHLPETKGRTLEEIQTLFR